MVAKNDYIKVLEAVANWPLEDRTALINDLVRGMTDQPLAPPPRDTHLRARGLLRTEGPPPTDEQVEQWIDEHRMSKYGGK